MKNLYILLMFFFVGTTNVFSQTATDIVTGLGDNYYMALHGDDLYFSQLSAGTLSKIDLTDPNFAVVDVITTLSSPDIIGLALNGDILYMGLGSGSSGNGQIVKVDLMDTTFTVVPVATGMNNTLEMEFHGADLYVAELNVGSRIAKVDVATGVVTDVLTGINPTGLEIDGDDLYFTEGGTVKKIDLTQTMPTATDVVTGMSFPVSLEMIGNNLYISDLSAGSVLVMDVTATLPDTATTIITGRNSPLGLLFDSDNNYMYIASQDGTISRFNVFPVSTDNVNANPEWTIFPNPAQDMIQFKDLTDQSVYQIINGVGQIVQEGTANPNGQIAIDGLSRGFYILHLENGELRQFIKN